MILTGKSKKDFFKWNAENDYILSDFGIREKLIHDVVVNALIIEWFSKISNIEIEFILSLALGQYKFEEAIEEAIKKANEIYNKSKK